MYLVARERYGRRHSAKVLEGQLVEVGQQLEQIRTQSSVTVLEQSLIHGVLATDLTRADEWRFRGGRASFLRAQTLPRLAAPRAGIPPSERIVYVEVLDPNDPTFCQAYANYRQQCEHAVPATQHQIWSVREVQLEMFATILAAAWYCQHSTVRVELALGRFVPAIRYDWGRDAVVITSADRTCPALRVGNQCPLFSAYTADLVNSFNRARRVTFEHLRREQLPLVTTTTTLGMATAVLRNARITAPETLVTEATLPVLLQKAFPVHDAYA
jgi:hypothetical protein